MRDIRIRGLLFEAAQYVAEGTLRGDGTRTVLGRPDQAHAGSDRVRKHACRGRKGWHRSPLESRLIRGARSAGHARIRVRIAAVKIERRNTTQSSTQKRRRTEWAHRFVARSQKVKGGSMSASSRNLLSTAS